MLLRFFTLNSNCGLRMRFHELRFHLGTKFVLRLHDTRMKCHSRTKVSFRNENRNELIPELLDFRLGIM